jgi:hypothetical protein
MAKKIGNFSNDVGDRMLHFRSTIHSFQIGCSSYHKGYIVIFVKQLSYQRQFVATSRYMLFLFIARDTRRVVRI